MSPEIRLRVLAARGKTWRPEMLGVRGAVQLRLLRTKRGSGWAGTLSAAFFWGLPDFRGIRCVSRAESRRAAAPAEAESASQRPEDDVAVVLNSPEEKARVSALQIGAPCFLRSKGTGDKTIAITFKIGRGMLKVSKVPQGTKVTLLLQHSGDFLPSTTDEMFAVRIEEGEYAGKSGVVYPSCVWAE